MRIYVSILHYCSASRSPLIESKQNAWNLYNSIVFITFQHHIYRRNFDNSRILKKNLTWQWFFPIQIFICLRYKHVNLLIAIRTSFINVLSLYDRADSYNYGYRNTTLIQFDWRNYNIKYRYHWKLNKIRGFNKHWNKVNILILYSRPQKISKLSKEKYIQVMIAFWEHWDASSDNSWKF